MTLAFGEIIGRVFANGDEITFFGDNKLSNGRQSIAPIDQIDLPLLEPFDRRLTWPYYWTIFAIACGPVRELPPARLQAGPGLDSAARGRGRCGERRAARQDQAPVLRDRDRRHLEPSWGLLRA